MNLRKSAYALTDKWSDRWFMGGLRYDNAIEKVLEWYKADLDSWRTMSLNVEWFIVKVLTPNLDPTIYPDTDAKYVHTHQSDKHQHIHKIVDSLFFILEGEGFVLSGQNRIPIQKWDRVQVPKYALHWFEVEGEGMGFISRQNKDWLIQNGITDLYMLLADGTISEEPSSYEALQQ